MERASKVELVLASEKGVIKRAFLPEQWLPATSDNFPSRTERPGRVGFVGREAPLSVQKMYVGKRISEEYRFGTANPIRYV
nr:hypothetical protein [Alkalimonas sp. MEB108]